MARLAIVSFRLGGTDGVAIEAQKWRVALMSLGHEVVSVAGEGVADVLVPGLAIDAEAPPTREELDCAFDGCDVVIVENLASLPLNIGAREVLYEVLEGRSAIFHHHDLAWQRSHLAHLEGPRDSVGWHHVVINEISRRQLQERGITSTLVMNSFDCDPPTGDRDRTRRALEVGGRTLVLLATRAIPRKNVQAALSLCAQLNAMLWILGPSEEGFGPELDSLLAASAVEVVRGIRDFSIHDAYAACDLVAMPSTWEGFGNPVLESVTHRRPLAAYPYPVAREIESFGLRFFGLDEVASIRRFLEDPDQHLLDANLELARVHFNVADLPTKLAKILAMAHIV